MTITDILNKFEKLDVFNSYISGDDARNQIKQFIRQEIEKLLNDIPLEEKEYPCDDYEDVMITSEKDGYNTAIEEIKKWRNNVVC